LNGLARDGFVVLVGPLTGTPDVLLIVRATSREEVARRLAEDPWAPWILRIGALP
jgi:hypothetical protein